MLKIKHVPDQLTACLWTIYILSFRKIQISVYIVLLLSLLFVCVSCMDQGPGKNPVMCHFYTCAIPKP